MGSQHPPEESQGHPLDGQEEPIKDVELLKTPLSVVRTPPEPATFMSDAL